MYANGDAPATPVNIKIENVISGNEKVEIGIIDVILLFIVFPRSVLKSYENDVIQHHNLINTLHLILQLFIVFFCVSIPKHAHKLEILINPVINELFFQ